MIKGIYLIVYVCNKKSVSKITALREKYFDYTIFYKQIAVSKVDLLDFEEKEEDGAGGIE
ncbi:hypothetical protein OU798_15040 [Prolixibacteraceae bacterium Z1-6]|uniref:Uncharacterized protein n=1 Tax=Draconibacterium aestuarii TaxID=2998507 RepID=A0A9X3F6W8_9BACT|nr:hypothetical protein [Prolixibacteraceae bacterium Z1-6]